MVRKGFWKSDWFLGVIVALVVYLLSGTDLIKSLERKAYDLGVRASSRMPSERVAVIAIDDTSIANIGRWPWSRDVHAEMIDKLAAAKAKTIAYDVFFSEPQIDRGLVFIRKIREALGSPEAPGQNEALVRLLTDAEQSLDTDAKLAASISKAGNVLLP